MPTDRRRKPDDRMNAVAEKLKLRNTKSGEHRAKRPRGTSEAAASLRRRTGHERAKGRKVGGEDSSFADYTSGKTGGNVRGPLSDVTSSAGDTRKRRGQRNS